MRTMTVVFISFVLTLVVVAGCRGDAVDPSLSGVGVAEDPAGPTPSPAITLSPTHSLTPTASIAQPQTDTPLPPAQTSRALPATATPSPTKIPTWPAPLATPADLSARAPDSLEIQSSAAFQQSDPPRRDDVQLAFWYRAVSVLPTPKPPISSVLPIGTRQTFSILNVDSNTVSQIEAELQIVAEHAYFWFDTGQGSVSASKRQQQQVANAFDDIYLASVALFGSESNPGIDGDARIHIVNVSPLVICNVTLETAGECGLAGYFSAKDTLPRAVEPISNEHEMFVMNAAHFGTDFYLSVLSHEFRHMIEDNYDRGDADWEVEGSAVLAATLLGYEGRAISRANQFLAEPDRQLTNWSENNTYASYGQSYLFNRFLYDRLGNEGYKRLAASPARGFAAIDRVAQELGRPDLKGQQLWLDWLAALAMPRVGQVPDRFLLSDIGLDHVAMQTLHPGELISDTVQQFAADFYGLTAATPVTVTFRGDQIAPLLGIHAASGRGMWVADRANYSDMRLTRAFDLSHVDRATLSYDVYHDIEVGYDFAYVAASTDSGATWQGLTGEHMQGLHPSREDPADAAYTQRFYTGASQGWQHEMIDLTPFAGQQVLIRFQYVTDPILTNPGIAIDNIAIPEIHFFDPVEHSQEGWITEGFIQATSHVPQQWQLQTITFAADSSPHVKSIPIEDGEATFILEASQNGRQSIVIVAGSTPMTLMPAGYQISVHP